MTEPLLGSDWLTELERYQKLVVGFSGGLDSTVLLHYLSSYPALYNKLSAIHIHHGLSANAATWAEHCQRVCASLGIPLVIRHIEFNRTANIEENARRARYQEFASMLSINDCLLLGHHQDDQAETLLLQLLRGAGVDGLAAMAPVKKLAGHNLCRPLLMHPRQTLVDYARLHHLSWIEDESNQNQAFSRNYLRHQVMPLLHDKWPGAAANLARTAHHCQQAQANLEDLALLDCPALADRHATFSLDSLRNLSHARVSNVVRVWLKNNSIRAPSANVFNCLIDEVIFAKSDAQPCVQWHDIAIKRYRQTLYIVPDKKISPLLMQKWYNFPQPVRINNMLLHATLTDKGIKVPKGAHISVGFRQGGEQITWHGQTKELKKLLQQWQVPPWQRAEIPLIYINDCLAAVVGFAISDHYFSKDGENVYAIRFQ